MRAISPSVCSLEATSSSDAVGAGAEEAAVVAERPQPLRLLDRLLVPGADVVGVEQAVVVVVAAHRDPVLPGGDVRDGQVRVHGAGEHERGVHAGVAPADHLAPLGHAEGDLGKLRHAGGGELALGVGGPVGVGRELAEPIADAVVLEQMGEVVLLGVEGAVLAGLGGGDEGVQVAVREGLHRERGELADLLRLVVAALLTGAVPGPLRLVDRADEAEVDPLVVAEAPDHVEQVLHELLVVLGREVRGAGVAVGAAVGGESAGRGVHESDEVLDAVLLRGAEEPAGCGVTVPVVAAGSRLEGLGGAPGVGDRLVDAAADVVAVLGQSDPVRAGEQQAGDLASSCVLPGSEVLRPPGAGGAEAVDPLVDGARIDRDPVRGRGVRPARRRTGSAPRLLPARPGLRRPGRLTPAARPTARPVPSRLGG
jgi:hypothetical protein